MMFDVVATAAAGPFGDTRNSNCCLLDAGTGGATRAQCMNREPFIPLPKRTKLWYPTGIAGAHQRPRRRTCTQNVSPWFQA